MDDFRGHDYYVRQFRDMKGSVEIDGMQPVGFASYCEVCGYTLSRAHARSGTRRPSADIWAKHEV